MNQHLETIQVYYTYTTDAPTISTVNDIRKVVCIVHIECNPAETRLKLTSHGPYVCMSSAKRVMQRYLYGIFQSHAKGFKIVWLNGSL